MSKQKISSIMQWFFGIIFIITGLGSFGNSLPFAIAALLFGITSSCNMESDKKKGAVFE